MSGRCRASSDGTRSGSLVGNWKSVKVNCGTLPLPGGQPTSTAIRWFVCSSRLRSGGMTARDCSTWVCKCQDIVLEAAPSARRQRQFELLLLGCQNGLAGPDLLGQLCLKDGRRDDIGCQSEACAPSNW